MARCRVCGNDISEPPYRERGRPRMGGQLVYVRRLQRRIRVCLEIPCLMELREILAEMDNMPRDQGKLYLDAELLNPYSHSNPLHTCDPWGNEVRYA